MNFDQASSEIDRGEAGSVADGGGERGGERGGGNISDSLPGVHEERTSKIASSKPVPSWLNSSIWSTSAAGGGGGGGGGGDGGGESVKEVSKDTSAPAEAAKAGVVPGANQRSKSDKSTAERANEYIPRVSLGRRSSEKENDERWSEVITSAPGHVSPPQRHTDPPPRGRLMSPRSQSLPTSMLFSGPGLFQRLRWSDDNQLLRKTVQQKGGAAAREGGEGVVREKGVKKDNGHEEGMDHNNDLATALSPSSAAMMEAEEEAQQQIQPAKQMSASLSHGARVSQFQAELRKERVNIAEIRRLASQGIPDGGSLRAVVWKLLLGYLPKEPEDWNSALAKKRSEYHEFKMELIINPSEAAREREEAAAAAEKDLDGTLDRQDITHQDHPLNMVSNSVWNQYFQDTELAEQIDRDVKRTHPDMHFFNSGDEQAEENQAAMKRALFIFAKLNPGVRYVQGMNEVLAPLLYIFKTDPNEANAAHAEEDAFFCFVELLSNFRDNFCQQLDNSSVGIRSTISRLNMLLRQHDEELWRHLDHTNKVNPQFYAFRWITLLLTQEFSFPDSLRLWDSLLSDPEGPLEILLRVCCAMLVCSRDQLLKGDFAANVKLLQNFPPIDVHVILATAEQFRPPFF